MTLDHWRITKDKNGLRYTLWVLGEDPQSFVVPMKWLTRCTKMWKEKKALDQDVAYQELYTYIVKLGTKRQQRLMRVKLPQG